MTDATAFGALYTLYAPHVRRFALYLSGDASLAEEVTAETFARAWTGFAAIRQETVKAYLFTIARNLIHDARRHSSRYRPLSEDLIDPAASHQAIEDRSELSVVLAAMQSLTEDDRAALLMRVDEVSYDDIARTLGLSVSAAKVRVHRARIKLMQMTGSRNRSNPGSKTP